MSYLMRGALECAGATEVDANGMVFEPSLD
jgi:hypothetical protein